MKKIRYTILYRESVAKDLKKIPWEYRAQIVKKIQTLAVDATPVGSVKLRGSVDLYRIRQGEYRIIYELRNNELIVMVIKIGHRREVYQESLRS
ncbi:type II toxin-antitoxin system RelE/ParE family toxin [Patescibacteria group bacterium]|nr:type II toxin-antitoxin system RelE/ParE family toxin [Patescibacteria group bacterium]